MVPGLKSVSASTKNRAGLPKGRVTGLSEPIALPQRAEVNYSQTVPKSRSLVPKQWLQGFLKPLAVPTSPCWGMGGRGILATLQILV